MNNLPKISLTIKLEGSTLVRRSEPDKFEYVLNKRKIEPNKKWKGKDGLKVVKRVVNTHYSLVPKEASMHINMTVDAYDYMTSSDCPEWMKWKLKEWKKMTPIQRLECHLQRTCDHFNGKSFSYVILDD